MKQSAIFTEIADKVAKFQLNNFQDLSKKQRSDLTDVEFALRDLARRLVKDATKIAWNDMEGAVREISKATAKMKKTQKHLTSVKRILTFATAAITLAGAILAGNPITIGTAGLQLISLSDKFAEEDEEAAEAADAIG